MTISDFGGRKFVLSIVLLLITFILVILSRLSADDYIKIVLATLAVFTGTNALLKSKIEPPKSV